MRNILFLVGLFLASGASSAAPAASDPLDFQLTALDGSSVSIAGFRGKWLVLNYWATWCLPCVKEFPELDHFDQSNAEVTVLGLNFEDGELARIHKFLARHPVHYQILRVNVYDPPEALGAPMALPTSFIVNPQGHLVKTIIGPVTKQSLSEAINKLKT